MTIFETERLIIKTLEKENLNDFTELLTDLEILKLIPQKPLTKAEISKRFNANLNLKTSDLKSKKCVCGIFEKDNAEMIGLSLFLINEDDKNELGYRFKVNYWNKSYGTETTKGMLTYYFNTLNVNIVYADVNTENLGSVKILSKFMQPVKEFFNERDNCTDKRYKILKSEWKNFNF